MESLQPWKKYDIFIHLDSVVFSFSC